MSESTPSPRPPIYSREAAFYTELPEQCFEQYREEWCRGIAAEFPDAHQEARWKFEMDGYEHGLPKLKDTRPSMWVDYWHERRAQNGNGNDEVRVYPSERKKLGGILIRIDRDPRKGARSYCELRALCRDLLPRFENAFQIGLYNAIRLEYVNIIRSDQGVIFSDVFEF